jgi:HPt (histidine-containing phosphotransfer) domain-containing protein
MSSSIDFYKIKDLISIDPSKELLQKLVVIFNVEVQKALTQIKFHIQNQDFLAVSQLSHRMRSTSLNLGATNLGEVFRQLEYLNYETASLNEMSSLVAQAENFYALASQDLKQYI